MTILECLEMLPENMKMIDLITLSRNKIYTVKELKQEASNEEGYDIYKYKVNYGRKERIQIGARSNNGDITVIYRQVI